ncbi:MAG: acyl carrier protein [Parahaliea sp.]
MDVLSITITLLESNLQLNTPLQPSRDTPLLGAVAELNSLTITSIIAAIEEETGSEVDDAEISAELFETVGSLADFIAGKLA